MESTLLSDRKCFGYRPDSSLNATEYFLKAHLLALRELEWVKFDVFTAPATWK